MQVAPLLVKLELHKHRYMEVIQCQLYPIFKNIRFLSRRFLNDLILNLIKLQMFTLSWLIFPGGSFREEVLNVKI